MTEVSIKTWAMSAADVVLAGIVLANIELQPTISKMYLLPIFDLDKGPKMFIATQNRGPSGEIAKKDADRSGFVDGVDTSGTGFTKL